MANPQDFVAYDTPQKRSVWLGVVIVLLLVIIGLQFLFMNGDTPTGAVVAELKDVPPVPTVRIDADAKYKLLQNVLRLERTATHEKIQFARLINNLQSSMNSINDADVQTQWARLIHCIANKCAFNYPEFELLLVERLFGSSQRQGITDRVLQSRPVNDIHLVMREALLLQKAATSGDIVAISRSVDYINTMIVRLNEPSVTDDWNALLECNYTCDAYNPFLVSLTEMYLD